MGLFIVAGLGIVVIVLAVHGLGGTVDATVGDEVLVRARYRRDVAGSDPEAVVVGHDGRAALVADPEIGVAAVVPLGDGLVVRPLTAPSVAVGDDGLRIDPRDPLLSAFLLRVDRATATDWAARIAAGPRTPAEPG